MSGCRGFLRRVRNQPPLIVDPLALVQGLIEHLLRQSSAVCPPVQRPVEHGDDAGQPVAAVRLAHRHLITDSRNELQNLRENAAYSTRG